MASPISEPPRRRPRRCGRWLAISPSHCSRSGLDHRLVEARGFYTVIAVPIMAVMMWLGSRRDILGPHTLSIRHRLLGWFATAVMAAAVVAMLAAA
jgi:Mn2+/Fe2+ NRAMP family transporter